MISRAFTTLLLGALLALPLTAYAQEATLSGTIVDLDQQRAARRHGYRRPPGDGKQVRRRDRRPRHLPAAGPHRRPT